MKPRIFILLFVLFHFSKMGVAQLSNGGAPLTFYTTVNIPQNVPKVVLPALDNTQEEIRTQNIANNTFMNYYGTIVDQSISIRNQGVSIPLSDGGTLWLLEIESPGAYGMQLYFDQFNLPPGARLFFYNEQRDMVFGAYTDQNNQQNPNLEFPFGTDYLEGDKMIVEYYEPANVSFSGQLNVGKVVHAFENLTDLNKSLSCELDVNCSGGWTIEERTSVALVLINDFQNQAMGMCSGTLINNISNDGTPYFYMAEHCIENNTDNNGNYDASNWTFKFNYRITDCSGGNTFDPNSFSVYGATYLTGDHATPYVTDHLLLQLWAAEIDFELHEVCYAGWDSNDFIYSGDEVISIHHPGGDRQKISFGEVAEVYSNIYTVDWNDNGGTVEKGSSGGPLFTHYGNRSLIGHLIEGAPGNTPSDCDDLNYYYFGRFSDAFDDMSSYLRPESSAWTTALKYCPGDPNTGSNQYDCDCYVGFTNNTDDGFEVNWSNKEYQKVCIDEPIEITAMREDDCCSSTFSYSYQSEVHSASTNQDCIDEDLTAYKCAKPFLKPCRCYYTRLFISLIECDTDLNPVGQEYADWMSFNGHDPATTTYVDNANRETFDLRNFLPAGAILETGKIYRLKIATSNTIGGWQEQIKYLSIVDSESDHFIDNQVLTGNWTGQSIYISNSTVDQNANIEVIASKKIELSPSSVFQSGLYEIGINDCSQLNERVMISEDNSYDAEYNWNYDVEMSKDLMDEVRNLIIYPNPTTGIFTIDFGERVGSADIEIRDVYGKSVYSKTSSESRITIDLSSESRGIYLVTVIVGDERFTKKLIHQ